MIAQPRDLDVAHLTYLPSTFGKCEVEVAAWELIRFFQKRCDGKWTPFTFQQLHAFYVTEGWNPDKMLFGLMGSWFDDGGACQVWESAGYVVHTGHNLVVNGEFVKRVEKFKRKASSRHRISPLIASASAQRIAIEPRASKTPRQ